MSTPISSGQLESKQRDAWLEVEYILSEIRWERKQCRYWSRLHRDLKASDPANTGIYSFRLNWLQREINVQRAKIRMLRHDLRFDLRRWLKLEGL